MMTEGLLHDDELSRCRRGWEYDPAQSRGGVDLIKRDLTVKKKKACFHWNVTRGGKT